MDAPAARTVRKLQGQSLPANVDYQDELEKGPTPGGGGPAVVMRTKPTVFDMAVREATGIEERAQWGFWLKEPEVRPGVRKISAKDRARRRFDLAYRRARILFAFVSESQRKDLDFMKRLEDAADQAHAEGWAVLLMPLAPGLTAHTMSEPTVADMGQLVIAIRDSVARQKAREQAKTQTVTDRP